MIYPVHPIGDYVTLRQGLAINKGTKQYVSSKRTSLPLLKIADMQAGSFDTYIDESIPNSFCAKPNDLIYSRTGRVGLVFRNQTGVVHNNCFVVTPIDESQIDRSYLYYAMQNDRFRDAANTLASGAAQPDLSHPKFKSIPIAIPSIERQRTIAFVLMAYDNLIENNRRQIALLEEAAQRLYKEWFVDLRFPGYDGIEFINGMPRGWSKQSILGNNLFIVPNTRVERFDGERTYFATGDVAGTDIISAGTPVTYETRPSRASVRPTPNTVWFARMSNSRKVINCNSASWRYLSDALLSSGFAGFTSIAGCYEYVYCSVASDWFDQEKNRYATGATQVSLTNEGLKKIFVLIPDVTTARNFSEMIRSVLLRSEVLKNENRCLASARNHLLPKLMSGEIEV